MRMFQSFAEMKLELGVEMKADMQIIVLSTQIEKQL